MLEPEGIFFSLAILIQLVSNKKKKRKPFYKYVTIQSQKFGSGGGGWEA